MAAAATRSGNSGIYWMSGGVFSFTKLTVTIDSLCTNSLKILKLKMNEKEGIKRVLLRTCQKLSPVRK